MLVATFNKGTKFTQVISALSGSKIPTANSAKCRIVQK